ncbi:MAG: DUF2461 domain-containing protein [Chitinophagales bacterium]
MLHPGTITFLEKLSKNNNKPWFDKHRDSYASAKEDYESLVGDILDALSLTEPVFKEQKAKDCIFRIFRDVRFSKDKTPYKAHFGAYFSKAGRKFPGAGYYLHVAPGGKSFAGGGLWMPEPHILKAVRQEIDYNFKEFNAIIEEKKFKKLFNEVSGEQLKTIPQGYTGDNPAIEYLKMKSFTVGHNITDTEITGKNFTKKVVDVFNTMKPFIDFLNRQLD